MEIMKTKIVLAGLLVSMVAIEVSARQEYDDMYFRGKDREKNKSIGAETAYASAKTKKQKPDEVFVPQEEDNLNPTDSYSARNINPEYVSRSNAEKASEDESNYYLQGYVPASTYSNNNFNSSNNNFNNSYYNNANWASNSFYGGSRYDYFNRGYGCGYCSPQMSWMITSSPFYSYNYYDPWMTPYYPAYGSSGLSLSFMYGSGYGYGNPYYGGGYGYPGYYGGNNYYESAPTVNYGKRPSRHSAVVQPTQRTDTRTRNTLAENSTRNGNSTDVSSNNRIRPRQTQDEYYVRPSRRSSAFDNPSQLNSGRPDNGLWSTPQNTQPSRRRDSYDPSPSSTPSFSPSTPSPSRGGSGGSSGGGGGSAPRPRGRD